MVAAVVMVMVMVSHGHGDGEDDLMAMIAHFRHPFCLRFDTLSVSGDQI